MRLILLMFLASTSVASAGERIAFFGVFMIDTSLQTSTLGQDPAELDRLAALELQIKDRFTQEGFEFVDLTPAQNEIDRVVNLAKCYGCDTRIAAKLNADYSLVGEVQKVSNAILTLNLQMRDATTGNMVKGGVVDIRGNTDDTWRRGMRSILNNRFFKREK